MSLMDISQAGPSGSKSNYEPHEILIPGLSSFSLPALATLAPIPSVCEEPIKFPFFGNIAQTLNYLTSKTAERTEELISMTNDLPATCIAAVFPVLGDVMRGLDLLSRSTSTFPVPATSDALDTYDSKSGTTVRFIALEALCMLVKPYSTDRVNAAYVQTRFEAFCAGCRIPKPVEPVGSVSMSRWIAAVNNKYDFIPRVVGYLENHKETNPQVVGLLDQVKLVWKGQGMTMTQVMYRFATESNNRALITGPILVEAARFKKLYDSISKKMGEYFMYSKILRHSDIEALNHKGYPNLYTVAARYGLRTNMLSKNITITANIGASMTSENLDKLLNEDLPSGARTIASGVNTDECMSVLGLNASILIPRKDEDLIEKLLDMASSRKRSRLE